LTSSAPFFLLGAVLSPFLILHSKSRKFRWILIFGAVQGIAFSACGSSTPFFHGPVLDGFSLFFGVALVLATFRHRVVQYLDEGQGNATQSLQSDGCIGGRPTCRHPLARQGQEAEEEAVEGEVRNVAQNVAR